MLRSLRNPPCPECKEQERIVKNGTWDRSDRSIQTYLCKNCHERFSDPKHLKDVSTTITHRVRDSKRRSKNLKHVTNPQTVTWNLTQQDPIDPQQMIHDLIEEFLIDVKGDGLTQDTVDNHKKRLRYLLKRNVDILEPKSVRAFLADSPIKGNTKQNIVCTCDKWFRFIGKSWKRPRYSAEPATRYIPTEEELDQIRHNLNRSQQRIFFELTYDTGARGKAVSLIKWSDIDFQRHLVIIGALKHGYETVATLRPYTMRLLNSYPKNGDRLFTAEVASIREAYCNQRKRIAKETENLNINKICYHVLRHYWITQRFIEGDRLRQIQRKVGHKSINSTAKYEHSALDQLENEAKAKFIVKKAKTDEEVETLLSQGFTHDFTHKDTVWMKKRR